jgi:gamma-tubulin complex component 3
MMKHRLHWRDKFWPVRLANKASTAAYPLLGIVLNDRRIDPPNNISRQLYEKLKEVADPKLAEQVVVVLSKVANADTKANKRHTTSKASKSKHAPSLLLSTNETEKQSGDRLLLAQQVEREETLLLRECLYALQGIDGERIRYHWSNADSKEEKEDGIRVQTNPLLESVALDPDIPSRIGSGGDDALRMCGEAGWLLHRLQCYIKENNNTRDGMSRGMVSQALAGALSDKCQDYYALLSSMEAEIATSGLTLRQLLVDLHVPTMQLRTLAMVTDGISHLSGGQLLSALYQHSLHGDTRHRSLVQNLLSRASQPWYQLLFQWTTQGELVDPHYEFFIQENSGVNDKQLWSDGYTIRQDQIIPHGILDQDLVQPALILGKGINFIRRCLLDTEWRLDLGQDGVDATSNDETRELLGYQYVAESAKSRKSKSRLQKTLVALGNQVHSHILTSLRDEHHLMDHLWGLKQFLFLGQGDFFSAFMEGMHVELGERKGLAGIYRHSIMSIMDEAIRNTNARQLPPYVLERLQVEVMISKDDDAYYQFAPAHDAKEEDTRSAWDVVQLDYIVPDTLSAIVDEFAMKQYKQVFSLLFQLKRVEFVLNSTWRQSTSLHHAMQRFAQHNAIQASSSSAYARSLVLLRKISMARQSMMHFVGNLKSYFMLEVLELGWKDLSLQIAAAKTLDEVIDAHRLYLTGVVRKSLLTSVTGSRATESEKVLSARLHELLTIAKAFCELQERLFSKALSAVERATEKRRDAEERLKEGKWGFSTEEDFQEEESFFGLTDTAIAHTADRILQDFTEKTKLLLEGLHGVVNGVSSAAPSIESMSPAVTPSSHSKASKVRSTWTIEAEADSEPFDHDSLRFLTFQLDFSGFYNNGKL